MICDYTEIILDNKILVNKLDIYEYPKYASMLNEAEIYESLGYNVNYFQNIITNSYFFEIDLKLIYTENLKMLKPKRDD